MSKEIPELGQDNFFYVNKLEDLAESCQMQEASLRDRFFLSRTLVWEKNVLNANSMLQQFTCHHMTSSDQPHVSENEEGMWEAYVMFSGSQDE